MKAAEQRKLASIGDERGVILADSELQDRAIFSGFDIDYNELVATSTNVADHFSQAAYVFGLRALFTSAWCDGLLTGLLLASLPPTPAGGANEGAPPEGE
jgi:hypothetical protein